MAVQKHLSVLFDANDVRMLIDCAYERIVLSAAREHGYVKYIVGVSRTHHDRRCLQIRPKLFFDF